MSCFEEKVHHINVCLVVAAAKFAETSRALVRVFPFIPRVNMCDMTDTKASFTPATQHVEAQ